MYPIQLHLLPGPDPTAVPSQDDVTQICTRARDAFPSLEHIRIRPIAERILLTMFIAAGSSSAAAVVAQTVARHIVATESTVRGWNCSTRPAAGMSQSPRW